MSVVLVALDSSTRAPAVLRRAAHLAKAEGSTLHVLRSVGIPPEIAPDLLTLSPDALPERLVADAAKDLTRLVGEEPLAAGAVVEAQVGTPWRTICAYAREKNASVIVIGTHGHSVLDTLLGTTAARVVNHAPCSVLVVREPAQK